MCASVCKCATYVQEAAEGEEGTQCPGAGVTVNCELPTWVLETTQEGLQCTSKYKSGNLSSCCSQGSGQLWLFTPSHSHLYTQMSFRAPLGSESQVLLNTNGSTKHTFLPLCCFGHLINSYYDLYQNVCNLLIPRVKGNPSTRQTLS